MRDLAELARKQKEQSDARRSQLLATRQEANTRAKELRQAAENGTHKIADLQHANEIARLQIPGYFPTPKNVVARIIELTEPLQGKKVLEPSAGRGAIANAAKEAEAVVDCIEYNYTLYRELQKQDYYAVVNQDFLTVVPMPDYDAVLMNPPFENLQDIEHVQHAYKFLKAGGRLVAVMSEGAFFRQGRKEREFREWLDEVGGTSEPIEDGAFLKSERPTGVKTRLVIIDKF